MVRMCDSCVSGVTGVQALFHGGDFNKPVTLYPVLGQFIADNPEQVVLGGGCGHSVCQSRCTSSVSALTSPDRTALLEVCPVFVCVSVHIRDCRYNCLDSVALTATGMLVVCFQCPGLKNPHVRDLLLTSEAVQSLPKRERKKLFSKHGFKEGVRSAFEHPPFARLMGPYTMYHRLSHVRDPSRSHSCIFCFRKFPAHTCYQWCPINRLVLTVLQDNLHNILEGEIPKAILLLLPVIQLSDTTQAPALAELRRR